MFSDRSSVARDTNALSLALAERRARSLPILDLTVSNPTSAGIAYEDASIRAALSEASVVRYEPHPFGMLEARRAVQSELAPDGIEIDPARIVLTASTSEAYAFAFTLLCDPGDEVLVPQPSYPLLTHLAGYAGVTLSPLFSALRRALAPGHDGSLGVDRRSHARDRWSAGQLVSCDPRSGQLVCAGARTRDAHRRGVGHRAARARRARAPRATKRGSCSACSHPRPTSAAASRSCEIRFDRQQDRQR